MSYLLDTNHCSYIINGNPQVTDALKSYAGLTIGVSIITYAELLYMTEKSALKSQNLGAVQVFCPMLICILLMKKLLLFTVVLKHMFLIILLPKTKVNVVVSKLKTWVLVIMIFG